MFSTLPKTKFKFLVTFSLSSARALNLDRCTILSFGKGLNLYSNTQKMYTYIIKKANGPGAKVNLDK